MSHLPVSLLALVLALGACAPVDDVSRTAAPLRVALTQAEAQAVLSLANSATADVLTDDVGLDADEVDAILAGRPFASIDLLEGTEDVDGFTLTTLLAYAMDAGLYEPNTPACEPGTIQFSDGRVFYSMYSASSEFEPGEVVTVCDGYFNWGSSSLMDLTVRGVGDVTIKSYELYVEGASRMENLTLIADSVIVDSTANIRPDFVAEDVVFDTRVLQVAHGSLTLRDSRIENAHYDILQGETLGLIVSEGAHAALFDTTVENFPRRFPAVTIEAHSSLEMVGGGILGNMEGVAFRGDEARFEDVDFGLGPADNGVFDVRVERGRDWASYLDLHDNVTGTCEGYECSFEGQEAP